MSNHKEFIRHSAIHESLFVGYLWNNPTLYGKFSNHNISRSTFTVGCWHFYYYIGLEMYKNSIREFDDTTVYAFLTSRPREQDKKSWFEYYDEYGGYDLIEEVKEECLKEQGNQDYHFSEIQKYESLRKLEDSDLINVDNEETLEKLTQMNLKQIQTFIQTKTSEVFSHINSGEIVEYNLADDLDEAIDRMNAGEAMGMPLHDAPRLNKKIKGWKKGDVIYLVMSSGVGKSSIAMEKFALSLYENNEKGAYFANEESVWKTRNLLLATVSSKILNAPINREKLSEGGFSNAIIEKLKKARDWVLQFPLDFLKFFDLTKYRVEDVINRIQMLKPRNVSYYILDTFKPDNSASENARWEAFSQSAQILFDCIKAEANNAGLLATVQLKIGKEYRYLDLSAIGKSLEIVEVAAVVLMGRLLYEDEYPTKKEAIFAYNYIKDEINDKWVTKEYVLNKDKTYMILFLAKNRNGSVDEQILYEVNYGINSFKEVAYVKMGKKSNTVF